MAFFTFARKSNLAPDSVHKHSKLLREHTVVGSRGLFVTFNWTKTIQFGQRKLIIPIVAAAQSVLCPLKAYLHMCA